MALIRSLHYFKQYWNSENKTVKSIFDAIIYELCIALNSSVVVNPSGSISNNITSSITVRLDFCSSVTQLGGVLMKAIVFHFRLIIQNI